MNTSHLVAHVNEWEVKSSDCTCFFKREYFNILLNARNLKQETVTEVDDRVYCMISDVVQSCADASCIKNSSSLYSVRHEVTVRIIQHVEPPTTVQFTWFY